MISFRSTARFSVLLFLAASHPAWAQPTESENFEPSRTPVHQDRYVDGDAADPSGFVQRAKEPDSNEERQQAEDLAGDSGARTAGPERAVPSPVPAVAETRPKADTATGRPEKAEIAAGREDGAEASLKVLTWGGAYRASLEETVAKSFGAQQKTRVALLEHELTRGKELSALTAADISPDVVEVGAAALAEGCEANRLARLDTIALAAGATEVTASEDYLPGGLAPCGVATYAWSSLIGVNTKVIEKKIPKTLAHVFDSKRYGGKRAFVKSPKFILEMALLADKVKAGKIYETLESDKGVARALKKLAKLKKSLVWAASAADAMQMLRQGKVAMAQVFSGRAAHAVVRGAPLNLIWDQQIYVVNYLAIPASSTNLKASRDFIAFATAPRQMAEFASLYPYGPMRASAVAQVDEHKRVKVSLSNVLPTAPGNFKRAFQMDEAWWSKNEDRVRAKFEAWLSEQTANPAAKNKKK